MAVKFANLASSTLASSLSNSATSISVADASSFPALGSGDYFYASIGEGSLSEIVKVTAVSSNTLTVVRGQDSTTARSHDSGTSVALRVVAAALDDIASQAQTAADTESVSIAGDTMTGALRVPAGSAASPSLLFAAGDLGLYKPATGEIAIAFGGNERVRFKDVSSGSGTIQVEQYSIGGTANNYPAYSFLDDPDTGLYLHGTGEVGLSVGAETALLASSTGVEVTGTISSGAITSSGNITVPQGQIVSDGTSLIIDGDDGKEVEIRSARDIRLVIDDNNDDTTNEFHIYKHSVASGNELLTIDQSGNADFGGTISSGAITSTGNMSLSNTGTGNNITINRTDSSSSAIFHVGSSRAYVGTTTNHIFEIRQNDSAAIRIDTSGNTTVENDLVVDGNLTATTQSASDNSTKVATTAYVDSAVSGIVDSAPGTLNTLNELAAALGDDANFSTTVTNSIATKLPLAGGTLTGDLTMSGNDTEIRFTGGNNRILFSGYRALEGATNGGILQVGEGYTTVQSYGHLNLTSGHAYQVNGTDVITSSREGSFATRASFGGVDSTGNNTPSTDELVASGYGLIGNRGTVYLTNSNSGGSVQIGVGSSHNSNPKLIVSSGGVDVKGAIAVEGNNVIDSSRNFYVPSAGKLYFGTGSHTYISEDTDDRLRFFAGGAEFMRFTESTTDTINFYQPTTFTFTDSTANQGFNGLLIDHNISGDQAISGADYTHISLNIDTDSSVTTGNTADEHRVRGANIVVRATGDSDQIFGTYSQSEAQHGEGTVSEVTGVYGVGMADEHTAGSVSNVHALRGIAYGYGQGTGGTSNFYGVNSKVHLTTAQDKNSGSLYGGYFEVETDNPGQAQSVGSIYGVYSTWDDDSGGNVTATNSFLFYGTYAGTGSTTGSRYGVYIASDVTNFFNGLVRSNQGYQIAGTTVIDSSRNLTNIGTISSGAITSSSTGRFENIGIGIAPSTPSLKVYHTDNYEAAEFITNQGGSLARFTDNTSTNIEIGIQGGMPVIRTSSLARLTVDGANVRINSGDLQMASTTVIDASRNLTNINSISSTSFISGTSYRVSGTTVIDSSRNLTNIGTVTSGQISATVNSAQEYSSTEPSEFSAVGSDALYLFNSETTSTYGKVSIMMRNNGSGGSASGRITLKNNRSGSSAFAFLLRDNGHTGDQREKLILDSDGNLNASGSVTASDDIVTTDSSGTNKVTLSRYTGVTFRGNGAGSRSLGTTSNDALNLIQNNTTRVIIDTTGNVVFNRAGNTNRGNIALGPQASGTNKWSSISGAHYNQTTGSGNGSGAAGIFLIGSHAQSGSNDVYIGGGPYEMNPATTIRFNTHTATTHNLGGTEVAKLDSAGNFYLQTGDYKIGSTTVIDSSRNLTNIGTISSGAITSSGDISTTGGKLIVKSSSNGFGRIEATDANHMIILRGNRDSTSLGSDMTTYYQYGGTLAQGRGHLFYTGGVLADQTLKLGIHNDAISLYQPLYMGGTQVMDASRNMTSIGTISSGAVTASGNIRLNKEGTADASNQIYASRDLEFLASGWDTNNSVARDVIWKVRNVPIASVYPDYDLQFIESDQGSDYVRFKLHGRGSNNHTDPMAATFYGNVDVTAGTGGTNAGDGNLTVTGSVSGGTFKLGATTIIDSSRNLTSIGTISSGAITSSGTVTAAGTIKLLASAGSSDSIIFDYTGDDLDVTAGTGTYTGNVRANGYKVGTTTRINSVGDGLFTSLYIGSTNIVDTSRNLTNIGTISSGAITSSGKITATELEIDSTADSSYLSGNAKIATNGYIMATAIVNNSETGSNPAAITFGNGNTLGSDQISLVTGGSRRLYIDASGNFDFGNGNVSSVGTISSGAITSSGTVTASGGNSTNWNTAYGWGDHASAGYLTASSTQTKYLRSDTTDVMSASAGTNEFLTFQNTTSGGFIQLGFQQNDTDGLHHRLYFKAFKSSAGNAAGRVQLIVRGSGGSLTSDVLELEAGQRASWQGNDIFTDAYHPNADKWTTARTLSLTGDATGSVSWDGSANASITVAVGDADTVDSLHASSFIRSDANDNVSGHTEWQDNKQIRLGNSADMRMWHDGSHHYFRNYLHAGGNIYFQGEDSNGANRALVYMFTNSSAPYVSLYHVGNEKLRTVSGGINVYGDLTATGNVTAYSDIRKKTNIKPLEGGLDIVKALEPKRFDWIESGEGSLGFIAQEVEEYLPELVETKVDDIVEIDEEQHPVVVGEEEVKSLDYGKMVSVLWAAVKEQSAQIETLNKRIEELENGNN